MESTRGDGGAAAGRLAPRVAWRIVTEAPLVGGALAREPGHLLAWDEGRLAYLFDDRGQRRAAARSPAPILDARISDDGSLVALLLGGPRLMLLDGSLEPISDRPAPPGAAVLDVDPHGRYVAVATRQGENHLVSRVGRAAGRFASRQPLTHIRFVPGEPALVAAAGYGMLAGYDLEPGPGGTLRVAPAWEERLLSNLGRLEVTGDGATILASCFNMGIQRYDRHGHTEGSYHLGGTALHAVPDFPGRLIATATQEGGLALLNRAGNVRWRTDLDAPPVLVAFDGLGRWLVYGLPTGEIVRLDVDPAESRRASRPAAAPAATSPTLREPAWSVPVVRNADEAEVTVVAVLDEPRRVAVVTKGNRFRIFDDCGRPAPPEADLMGIGRLIRTCPGWIAAATDRQVAVYEAGSETIHRPDVDLVQVTHLALRPATHGLAIVQERDRVGRCTLSGRWIWRRELKRPVEEMAIGPHNSTAFTTEDGALWVVDAAGEPAGRGPAGVDEPLLLVAGPGDDGPTWVTLARRAQVLRGHAPDGAVLWESPTPWEGWQLAWVGSRAVVTAPDGRLLAFDARGFLRSQGGREVDPTVLAPGPDGEVLRLVRKERQLLCAEPDGRTVWRALTSAGLGPVAGGAWGVAALVGGELACYPHLPVDAVGSVAPV